MSTLGDPEVAQAAGGASTSHPEPMSRPHPAVGARPAQPAAHSRARMAQPAAHRRARMADQLVTHDA